MLKKQEYINDFFEMGDDPDISDIYQYKGNRVKLLSYKLYSSRQRKLEAKSIPPYFDSL